MPFILGTVIPKLCQLTKDLLSQEDFFLAVQSISAPKEDLPVVKEEKLYWNLTAGQGYVVIDPRAGKVFRVFYLDDELSDNYLCDSGLAMAATYDILNFIDVVNGQIDFEKLFVDEGPDNNTNGFVH